MNKFAQVAKVLLIAVGFAASSAALADSKTLIEMEGGKPAAALAKSWTKVKDGEYTFELDTTKEVKKGEPVTQAMVKQSLEAKLGTAYGVKVSPVGAAGVSVTYTGDEQKFLEQVAKAKIRGGKDVELALESSVSEGGIRAKAPDREAKAGEVKGIVSKVDKGVILAKVNVSKSDKVQVNKVIKIKDDGVKREKNDFVYFIPEKQEGAVWVPKAGTLE